jgi:hypothetical protein
MTNDQTATRSQSLDRASGTAGWCDLWQAARAQIVPDEKWPLRKFKGDLQAIQDQLLDDERILEIRTLHQGGLGRATGAIAVTTRRLLVVDLSRSPDPVAETVLFSEIKRVSCRRRGPFGVRLSVRTDNGRQYRGLESKQSASAKRFVAALQAQIAVPSASHLLELPRGAVAVKPPTVLARTQRAFELAQVVLAPVFPVAAVLVITGTSSNQLTQAVVGALAFLRAFEELAAALVVRSRGRSGAHEQSRTPIALQASSAE